jgi:hypothetical protein
VPCGAAGGFDELDEDAVAASRVEEGDRAFGALAGGRIDELHSVDLQAQKGLGEVVDLEAHVVEPLESRKRATPVVESVGSTSSTFDSPTGRKAILTPSEGMGMTLSSSRPRMSR